jgi:hypothetical protein
MGYSRIIAVGTADGPTLTAAAAATCIPTSGKRILHEGFFYPGRSLRIQASGRISSVITTPGTARFDVRVGGTVVFDSLAILLDTVAGHTNVGWRLDILLTCRANQPAASSNLWGHGLWTSEDLLGVPATAPKGVLSATLPWNTAPAIGANFDNGPANSLDMFFTQTVATGSMTVHQYLVEDVPILND